MTEVELPDGTVLEFPDDMGQDAIKAAIDKKFGKPAVQPDRETVATTDDGGIVYRNNDGQLGFTSPSYATTDQAQIAKIMEGATPADVSTAGFDEQTIAQQPVASRATKFLENVPFAGSYVDEAAGAVLGDKAARDVRAMSGAMDRQRPGESLALGLSGAVAGSLPMVAAAPEALLAKGGQTMGAQALKAAAVGSGVGVVEGGVYGAGRAEGRGRANNAKEAALFGGATGGALGAAAPYVSKAVSNLLTSLKGSELKVIASELAISPEAARVVKSALDSGDMRKATEALDRAGPNAMLADAGQPTQKLLDTATATGGAAGEIATDAVDERVTGAARELTNTLDNTLGKPSGVKAMSRGVRQETAAARGSAYDEAYSKPINYAGSRGRMLEGLLRRVPQDAVNKANALMRAEGAESAQIIAKIADDGNVVFETLPDVRQIDYITRALGDVADAADGAGKMGGTTQLGATYNSLKRNLRNALKGEVPEYAKALDVASDAISRVKAGELGNDLLKARTTREAVRDALKDASKAERDAAKQGVRTYIDDTLANVRSILSDPNQEAREAVKLLGELRSRANKDKLKVLLGDAAAEKLMKEVDRSAVAFELRAALNANSATFMRTSIDKAVDQVTAPKMLETLSDGEPINAAKRFVQALTGSSEEAQALRKAGIYEEIATALTQTRGSKAKAALKLIEQAKKGRKLTEQQASFIGNTVASSAFLSGNRAASTQLTTQ